ncbi:MAG: hypothetical protein U1F43_18475 [Myxococcota bacterium]
MPAPPAAESLADGELAMTVPLKPLFVAYCTATRPPPPDAPPLHAPSPPLALMVPAPASVWVMIHTAPPDPPAPQAPAPLALAVMVPAAVSVPPTSRRMTPPPFPATPPEPASTGVSTASWILPLSLPARPPWPMPPFRTPGPTLAAKPRAKVVMLPPDCTVTVVART